jgi:hypothetical protein
MSLYYQITFLAEERYRIGSRIKYVMKKDVSTSQEVQLLRKLAYMKSSQETPVLFYDRALCHPMCVPVYCNTCVMGAWGYTFLTDVIYHNNMTT